jgi:hypothetical protein
VLYQPAQKVRCVELSFGSELNPRNQDVDQKESDEQLNGIRLNCCAVVRTSGVKSGRYVVEIHESSPENLAASKVVVAAGHRATDQAGL